MYRCQEKEERHACKAIARIGPYDFHEITKAKKCTHFP